MFDDLDASQAVNGDTDGSSAAHLAHTIREDRPFWQVDLETVCYIESIKVYNRTDKHPHEVRDPNDLIHALFPFYLLIAVDPFPDGDGGLGLKQSKRVSIHTKFPQTLDNPIVWQVPPRTQGRYVRLQLDCFSSLSIAQVEVYGYPDDGGFEARASSVRCAEHVTMVVVEPARDLRYDRSSVDKYNNPNFDRLEWLKKCICAPSDRIVVMR